MLKVKYLLFTLILGLIISCNENEIVKFSPESDPIFGLASVQLLNPDLVTINLNDYILDFDNVDSVTWTGGEITYNKDSDIISLYTKNASPFSLINIHASNNIYSIVCKKITKQKVQIEFLPESDQKYKNVFVVGDFNSWSPNQNPMSFDGEKWIAELELDQGFYQYKLVCDSIWMNNPTEFDTIANGIGGYNSSLVVRNQCFVNDYFIDLHDFNRNSITISLSAIPDNLFILWQNQVIPVNLNNFNNFKYSFNIPSEAKQFKRSYIRIFASKKNCLYNDIAIPLEYGEVINDSKLLTRFDKHKNIIYSILVDRFNNGTKDNDFPLNDPRVAPKANFMGGDIKGIFDKINDSYFNQIGVNCLWISPIFQNPNEAYKEYPAPNRYFSGYHGYWPISLTEIDYRFGTQEDFKTLVNNAHEKNINVLLDFVANHVHEKNPLYQNNKDWTTNLILEDGRKNIRLWDEQRLTTWFDTFLPSWNFQIPEVTDTISNIALYWLKTYDLDGFRHDATKHIPDVFWRTLTKKIKQNFPAKTVFQIGETFGNRELIGSYTGSGMLDAQFDFNLYFDARNAFAAENPDMNRLELSLLSSLNIYGYNHLMGNITGNHDLIRFITYADNSILPGEDEKEAGWKRNIKIENIQSYSKLQNLLCFIMTIPGIPCIYYGDEIGMPGAGDPDNRRMMIFDNLNDYQKQTKEIAKKLAEIRKNNIEFIFGTTKIIESKKGIFVLHRKYFSHESYVIINQKSEPAKILLKKSYVKNIQNYDVNFNSSINELTENYEILLKPYSFEILIKK